MMRVSVSPRRMLTVSSLKARQILDSRGNPTVEVDCLLSDPSTGSGQAFGRAAVPSGASTGSYEALELRDGDKARYGGKGVTKAVVHVTQTLLPALKGIDVSDHRVVDAAMIAADGTPNKAKVGANALLGVSMAVCRARAASEKKSLWQSLADQYGTDLGKDVLLPVPMMNVINGGKHADSGLSFQECMIVPTDFPSFSEALRAGAEIFACLKKILADAGHVTAVGDEGGFAPKVQDSRHAFSLLQEAIAAAGYEGRVQLGIDCAASEYCKDGVYTLDGKTMHSSELVDYYAALCDAFPIITIEDSHAEDDWDGFAMMKKRLGSKIQLVGDDLLVTNTQRIKTAIAKDAVSSVLIKLNQIGSVSETVDAIRMAQDAGWTAVASHRSGETEDTFIAHLAVGLKTGQIKTGSLSRTDRVCKYNELLRIEEELGAKAAYAKPF